MRCCCGACGCRKRNRAQVAQPLGAVSVGLPASTTSRSSHIPLASLPATSDAMRYEPVFDGLKTKLADWFGSRPRCGSGVLHPSCSGLVSLPHETTAHDVGTVARFSHCTVICQPTGIVSINAPLP